MMKMIFGFLGVLVLVGAIGVGWVVYNRHVDDSIHTALLEAKTIWAMGNIGVTVIGVDYDTGQRPPEDNAELVTWLTDNGATFRDTVIIEEGRFVDIWGNDLVVMASEGEIFQLGSAGPNGQWEGGAGDDITSAEIDLALWIDEP